jgi:hypothetical protein
MHVRLLGPCFKTGRSGPFRQHPGRAGGGPRRAVTQAGRTALLYDPNLRSRRQGTPPKGARRTLIAASAQTAACASPRSHPRGGLLATSLVPRSEPMLAATRNSTVPRPQRDAQGALRSTLHVPIGLEHLRMRATTLVSSASLSAISSTF